MFGRVTISQTDQRRIDNFVFAERKLRLENNISYIEIKSVRFTDQTPKANLFFFVSPV